MRVIRRHAALLAMQGIAVMTMYFGALKPSMLKRVHAAGWWPREAGSADGATDAVVPAISRVFFRSRPLHVLLPLLWLVGVVCGFSVLFDGYEASSAREWLASAAGALMLPIDECLGASLNAKRSVGCLYNFRRCTCL